MLRVADHAKRTDPGRRRSENEDAHFVRPPLFVIADGMGGAQAGEVASHTAIDAFAAGLPDGPESDEQRLASVVAQANVRIHELAGSDEGLTGMGTTLTAAYVGPDDIAVAHVGDSRLYRVRDGHLDQLTDDHSLVGELVRRGQLSAEEAEDHPQRSIITRALGIEHDVVVDHHTWPARDGDIFLLCSDGLTDMVTDARMEALVDGADTLQDAAAALVREANEAGGRDNITVILFRVEEVTPQEGGVLADQHTMAGATAPKTDEVREAATPAPAPEPAPVPAAAAPAMTTAVAQRVPRAPRTPAAPSARERRRRPWVGVLKGFAVVAVLLVLVGSGAWIASRGVYFVGTDDHGFVTLYQGLPYDLPGLSLYQEQYVSGVPAQTLTPRVRRTVTEHKLRSQTDAVDLVRQLERGEIAGQ